ncbi:MAG TPA: S49 family peptidase [Methanosarcina sp.]|nr:S49 family peptidase [Methanosarcina sp.]
MNKLPFISQRIFNTPLAIHPAKAEVVIAALSDRLGISRVGTLSGVNLSVDAAYFDDDDLEWKGSNRRPYEVVQGKALIEISGTLVQKLGSLNPYSGMTGYDGIRVNLAMALEDDSVDEIVFMIDSPGGEVAGCFDLVDMIYNSRSVKPIHAILDEHAYSAAYAIASACNKIYVPRTGGLGHIGVITCHVDWSRAIQNSGVNVTFITYGDYKADGRPELPLSKDAFERIQADINSMGDLFSSTVARNRGVDKESIVAMQASTYMGDKSLSVGLADFVLPPDQAFSKIVGKF